MKYLLVIKLGRRKGAFDLIDLIKNMGKQMGYSNSHIKRLIDQGGVEVEIK